MPRFGPRHADEFQIFQRMRSKHGGLSWSRMCCPVVGLERLAVALELGGPLSSEKIVAHALAGEAHALYGGSVRSSAALLGRFAGRPGADLQGDRRGFILPAASGVA